MGGELQRPGVYLLPKKDATISQMIITAGIAPNSEDSEYVTILRKTSTGIEHPYHNLLLAKLLDGTEADIPAQPGDWIQLSTTKQVQARSEAQKTIDAHNLLKITIDDLFATGKQAIFFARVDPRGEICLPYVDGYKVAGLSLADAEKATAKAYQDGHVLNRPVIKVEFEERGTQISAQSAPFKPGDKIAVRNFDLLPNNEETKSDLVVDLAGTIDVPKLGEVKIEGLTEREVEKLLIDKYRDAQIISHAIITVQRMSGDAPGGL